MHQEPSSNPYGNGAAQPDKCKSPVTDAEEDQQGMETAGTPSGVNEPRSREAQYVGPYIVVPPDETKRSKLQQMAAKELEDLERWKAEHRLGPINMIPVQLGGRLSEAEARQKQLIQHRQAKYEKNLKTAENKRKKKEEEEAKIQEKKSIQREKANKLEEKKKQEELQREEQFKNEYYRHNDAFLTKLTYEMPASFPAEESTYCFKPNTWEKIHSYKELQKEEENKKFQKMKEEQRRKSEALEEKQREKDHQKLQEMLNQHRRVNSAFLDRLERQTGSTVSKHQVSSENSLAAVNPDSTLISGSTSLHAREAISTSCEDDCDQEWIIKKLHNAFPYYERATLGEILQQCNWDYNHACKLLLEDM